MFATLSRDERTALMDSLSRDAAEISWRDTNGRRYRRAHNRYTRMHTGRKFKVNAAAALTLKFAQENNDRPVRRALTAGLPYVVEPLGGTGSTLFSLSMTTRTLRHVLPRLTEVADPVQTRLWAGAAGSLVQRYLEQNTDESPISIRHASLRLMRDLNNVLPREPALFGAMFGTVFAGGIKYCAAMGNQDVARRYRRTTIANLVWAAQNAVPLFFVAGPVAVVTVAWASAWERRHAPRAYGAVLRHLRGEVDLLLMHSRASFSEAQSREVVRWMQTCMNLNGLT